MHRQSVSEAARALPDDGCITYTPGSVTTLDRDRLHDHACDCYNAVHDAMEAAYRGPLD